MLYDLIAIVYAEYNNQVLITMHRRDNHHNMDKWFTEIEKIANTYSEIEFMIPLHPNPNVQKHKDIFKKVKVVEPMNHEDLINYVDDRPGHDLRYSLDSSKIRNELNWNQKISFDDGIKKTVDWYLNNSNLYTDMQNEISKSTPWK